MWRNIFHQWRRTINVASRNISSVASHYQYCITENFYNIMLILLYREIFCRWHWMKNIISSAINMAEYFVSGVALSILYHGKFLWYCVNIIISRNILSMALNEEYCIHGVALSIWRNISSVASHYQYCIVEYFVNSVTILQYYRISCL